MRRRVTVDIQKVVFMLMAQDMARAIAFYVDVIGLEVRFDSLVTRPV